MSNAKGFNRNFNNSNSGFIPFNSNRGGFGRGGGRGPYRGGRNNFGGSFPSRGFRGGNRPQHNYGNRNQNQQWSKPQRDSPGKRLSEEDIGVTEYMSDHAGFLGIIKSRYSDFQVSEINEQGEIAKLTDLKPPAPTEEDVDEDEDLLLCKYNLEILPMETWDQINKLATSTDKNDEKVEIDVTGMSKEQRTKIHDSVKKAFGDVIVGSTINIDEKKYVKFEKFRKGVRIDNRVKWSWPGEYVYFIVHKENCDTMDAAARIAERLRLNIKPSMLGYAGTKDRRAKTSQWFSLRKVDPRRIAASTRELRDLRVGNYSFSSHNLRLGMLKGNRFRIALRNVTAEDEAVGLACERLRERGFINYYVMNILCHYHRFRIALRNVTAEDEAVGLACERLRERGFINYYVMNILCHYHRFRIALRNVTAEDEAVGLACERLRERGFINYYVMNILCHYHRFRIALRNVTAEDEAVGLACERLRERGFINYYVMNILCHYHRFRIALRNVTAEDEAVGLACERLRERGFINYYVMNILCHYHRFRIALRNVTAEDEAVGLACERLRERGFINYYVMNILCHYHRFRIALRNVTAEDEAVGLACERLRERGFINYYVMNILCHYHRFRIALRNVTAEDEAVGLACERLRERGFINYYVMNILCHYHRFRIALRNVTAEDEAVGLACERLRERGFINYYGLQRFGTRVDTPTYNIGLKLLQGNFKEAIAGILEEREGPMQHALRTYRQSGAEAALRAWPRRLRAANIELRLVRALAREPNDLLGALNKLARNTRLLYLHSYQSLVWNRALSERLRRHGLAPARGDLVPLSSTSVHQEEEVREDESDNEDDPETDSEAQDDKPDEPTDKTNGDKANNSTDKEKQKDTSIKQVKQKIPVKVLTQEDVDSGKYTIFDVILPLPGYMVEYPSNIKDYYEELLTKDGLNLEMSHKIKSYSMSGAYRHVALRPLDVEWSTVRYTDPYCDLILSDWDMMQDKQLSGILEDGKYKALLLNMTLPSSCYATMALRELLKVDTSCDNQALQNNYHKVKKEEKTEETEGECKNGEKEVKMEEESQGEKRKLDSGDEVDVKKLKQEDQ